MTKEQAIQEQLYRTRPATTNPKQDGYYVVVDPENIHLSQSFYFMEGDWFEDEIEARENENHDALDVDGCFWLEPYTPSLNAGSLEEAAIKWANENYSGNNDKKYQAAYNGFLAGAAYVKGGEKKGLTKEEIKAWLLENICPNGMPGDFIPSEVVAILDEFQRTSSSQSVDRESIVDKLYKVKEIIQAIRDKDETNAFNRDIHSQHAGNIHNAIETINSYWHSVYVVDNTSRPSLDIDKVVDGLKEIEKLSRYDHNHDNMLYNIQEINKLAKELLNQSK